MDALEGSSATAAPPAWRNSSAVRLTVLVLAFAFTLTIRVWGITRHFWLLGDQIRDWSIALGPLVQLPLVGPPTHVGGYTIGPAFYWGLWIIRVTVGPWFGNLPHAGGIGQAILQSGADALLLAAVWRRTGSLWIALATIVLVATASYDLCLSAIVWNPMMGSALAKIATALVLLEAPQRSAAGVAATAAIAWCAVQCYTGAIFVTVGVFIALLLAPFVEGDRRALRRNLWIAAIVVAVLQTPHAVHQVSSQFRDSAMGAVTGSVGRVLSGQERIQLATSWAGYAGALRFIQGSPWQAVWSIWLLTACGAVVAVKYRRDLPFLSVTLLPQAAAIVGYAFYVGDFLDHYYYFSLMPAAVLTVLLGVTAMRSKALVRGVGFAVLIAAFAIVPARLRFARTMHRMPEYGVLLDGSRKMAKLVQPMRAIRTDFTLPPTSSSEFLYTILGGHIDRASPWLGVIKPDGSVVYEWAEQR